MKNATLWTGIAAVVLGLGGHAALAEDIPVWEHALRAQLLHEHQCNLNYLTNVKVQDLGAVKSVEARAHCVNGQAFDVHSLKGSTKFKIEECGMSIC